MTAGFTPDDQDKLANTLLMLIEDLVTELHADKTFSFVLSLDSSLDDDLGLDSLTARRADCTTPCGCMSRAH